VFDVFTFSFQRTICHSDQSI